MARSAPSGSRAAAPRRRLGHHGCELGRTAADVQLDLLVGTAAAATDFELDLLVGAAAGPGPELAPERGLDFKLGFWAAEPLESAAGISRGLCGHLARRCG